MYAHLAPAKAERPEVHKFGKHGKWVNYGSYGWAKATIPESVHINQMEVCPWLICHTTPSPLESYVEFRRRRQLEKLELTRALLEQAGMEANDKAKCLPHLPLPWLDTSLTLLGTLSS